MLTKSEKLILTESDLNYNFTENKRYATIEEYNKAEIDLQEFTRLIDFTLYNGSLFLITTQHSDKKILDRHLIKCALDEGITPTMIESNHTPIHFGPNNHLFSYFEKDSIQFVEIVPLEKILN